MDNKLFPVFLKLEQLRVLIVGGGFVGAEKLSAILRNAPETKISLVAPLIREETLVLTEGKANINLERRPFRDSDLEDKDIVILATDDYELHKRIKSLTEARNLLTNVADTPELCDFYLGSIVKRGALKIAVSTNGQSPTFAKRFRQLLEEELPETQELEDLLKNLNAFRNTLKGDFSAKVKALNELTASLLTHADTTL